MEFHACDICREILKDKFYILAVNPINKKDYEGDGQTLTLDDFFRKLNEYNTKQKRKIQYKEICPGCYDVMTHLFKMRLKEIKNLKKEVDAILNQPVKRKRGDKENGKV